MIDDSPEESDFSQVHNRKKACNSLVGSIGWQFLKFELERRLKMVEDGLMEENLTKKDRWKLLGKRAELKELLALPTTILGPQ